MLFVPAFVILDYFQHGFISLSGGVLLIVMALIVPLATLLGALTHRFVFRYLQLPIKAKMADAE